MRENIRKWFALGALASVALVYPGCKSDSREPAAENSDGIMRSDSEEGTGGSGNTPGAMATDAGTGGAGSESMGTAGQGVSGSDSEQLESTGESNSGGVPVK
jgi:hypothetical protein